MVEKMYLPKEHMHSPSPRQNRYCLAIPFIFSYFLKLQFEYTQELDCINCTVQFSLSDAQRSSDTVPPHAPDSKVLMISLCDCELNGAGATKDAHAFRGTYFVE